MFKMHTANLKPVDRYGADQVQLRGTGRGPHGDLSALFRLIYLAVNKQKGKTFSSKKIVSNERTLFSKKINLLTLTKQ